jgi:oligopeptide/dipeptide ABC transporter ATP-binding protein
MTQTTGAAASVETTSSPILRAEGVSTHFASGGLVERLLGKSTVVRAVDKVDLTIAPAETLGIVGESGCGKTTLGRTLLRLYTATAGRVFFGDAEVTHLPERRLRPHRRQLQMIFQDPKASLNPRLTVRQVLRRTLKVHGITGNTADQRIAQCMRDVELDPDRFGSRYASELSGGEAQRVGIAKALLLQPDLIIADEPVSSLDVTVQAQIVNLLRRLQTTQRLAMLFISHDIAVVRHISDRIMVMYLGSVVEEGPAHQVFDEPLHPYTKALLDAVPLVGERRRPVGLSGQVPSPGDPPPGCPFQTRCPAKIGKVCEEQRPVLAEISSGHRVSCHLHVPVDVRTS